MADPVKALGIWVSFKAAFIRALRVLVAQLPAIIAWMQGNQVDPRLIGLGIFLNAAFKFLRDIFPGWIIWIPL